MLRARGKDQSSTASTRPRNWRGSDPRRTQQGEAPQTVTEADSLAMDPETADIPEVVRSQPYSGRKSARTQLALHLPPLYKLDDIYKSLTTRALELNIDDFLSHLGSKPLRVVTVCSGTESPLLALEMVQDNLRKHFGKNFEFQHLFSAEIVPFKQAYIERNFHPRFLFRDVKQLKDRVAQTAYGSLEKIPKNADLLIAGFSCVDFSGLNNKRKTLDEKGESGGTFWGIIRYAIAYRPRMVILENVKNAPWHKIEEHWNEINYFAVHMDVDTKAYYLPQTRERGYMFCVDRNLLDKCGLSDDDMRAWSSIFAAFKRPASSPTGMFLLDADDRRLEEIEKDMSTRITSTTVRATVDWAKYQVRHQSYRLNNELGYKRPISRSQDDGTCKMPDFAWKTWVDSLPERIWDTIDVNFLRKLVEGYDMNFKERCIELSQGLDREIDSRAYGIVGCITPSGIPYITTRGGPLCGLESLALQGLPLDRLLLTRESQRELQDLAGNAMSSTVVGAAVLSALIVGYKVLVPGEQLATPKDHTPKHKRIVPRNDYPLVRRALQLGQIAEVDTLELQSLAASSARYCLCERQSGIKQDILRCTACEHTACSGCAGNPSHAYERVADLVRSQPCDFISRLKGILPARLSISGICRDIYDVFHTSDNFPHVWEQFLDAVMRTVGDELRLLDVRRSEVWTVSYEGKSTILSLVISATMLEWLLFAKPLESEPALSLHREILSKPIARMRPIPNTLLEGTWEVCAPLSSRCTLSIAGTGNQIPSYEAKCGLAMERFADSTSWSQLRVESSGEDCLEFGVDVRGTYDLLPDCGTANACLHKKAAADGNPAVYLFLDPTKLGEPKNDSFVFSLEHRRIPGYQPRITVAELSHKWHSSKASDQPETVNAYYRKWTKAQTAALEPYAPDSPIDCFGLQPGTLVSIQDAGCHEANVTLLSLSAPADAIDSLWRKGPWEVTDPIESTSLLRDLSWLLQKASEFAEFQDWNIIIAPHSPTEMTASVCHVCVPPSPQILWGRNKRDQIIGYEDPRDAALYERQIKSKPSPFLIFRRVDDDDVCHLCVTLNVQTLLHQAYARLASTNSNRVSFHWRVVPNAHDVRNFLFPKFSLLSNRNDLPSGQPKNFLVELRPEQLRSLSWMVQQEKGNIAPFVEEEIEEAFLPSMMWRAEAKVTMEKTVRGGVLADDVGYGKTAITLGLIDTQYRSDSVPEAAAGFIPTKATLIIVPQIMVQQWVSEIRKFLGTKYKVLVISSGAALSGKMIRDFVQADIILVSWSVFNAKAYYEKMQKFTGMPRVPEKAGRNFDAWFAEARNSLREHVQVLVKRGPDAFLESVRQKRQSVKDAHRYCTYDPSRRLRGKKYAEANKNDDAATNSGVQYADVSSAEEYSDGDDDDEDPERLRRNVERFMGLQSHAAQTDASHAPTEAYSEEESAYEESSAETINEPKSGLCQEGRKMKRKLDQPNSGKREKKWNDHKEFNIKRGKTNWQWDTVKTPLLHAFLFNRIVIDEFTYANSERLAPLLALEARSKWVLSGTPPLNDFADVKTIAPFLGIHLGVDDEDSLSQNNRLKILRKQRSDAETFQSWRAPRSEAWHQNRHVIAQRFLDRFARQNVAEIDEIPMSEHIVLIDQSPAECTIYLELYKQLMTHNRQLRRSGRGRFSNDQLERLDEIIGSSATPEEALLKRCSSLALHGHWEDGKPEAITCSSIIAIREKQLRDLESDFMNKMKLAAWIYFGCDLKYEKFHKFVESIFKHDFGDMTVTSTIYPLFKTAMRTSERDDWKLFFKDPEQQDDGPSDEGPDMEALDASETVKIESGEETEEEKDEAETQGPSKKAKLSGGKGAKKGGTAKKKGAKPERGQRKELPNKPTEIREFEPVLRDATTTLRNIIVEWVLRKRALRFLTTVRQIQAGSTLPGCDCCRSESQSRSDLNVLGSCGHALCKDCVSGTVQAEECAVKGCRGSGKRFNVINADSLGIEKDDHSTRYGGSKMDKLVEILKEIPKEERAILFIQYKELIEIASKALELANITHTVISANDSKKVEEFKKPTFGNNKVLVLNLGSEMAAGLNLQCANHVIFLSPMLTQTQYDYVSSMTQAVGRARRYGQPKHVHVYHLLVKRTIDVNIFQERQEKILIERDGQPALVSPSQAADFEKISCQGPSLVVDNAF